MLENVRCQLRVNMPRTYERKTNRQSWSQESMEGAIEEVLSVRMGYLKASKAFNVPQSTLEDRVKEARTNQLTSSQVARKRFRTVYRQEITPKYSLELMEENGTMLNAIFFSLFRQEFGFAQIVGTNKPRERRLGSQKRHPGAIKEKAYPMKKYKMTNYWIIQN
ncbi:hypothetical protein JTB14_022411 [Gonioctena quinquepunctata]|nr:hypothetical protein JTB14_022411 [Gonioctena quinquepunctata]